VRVIGCRHVRGWRQSELEQFYDMVCWSDEPIWRDRIRNRGGVVGVDPIEVGNKLSKAKAYRELYAEQAAVRLASKNRVVAWRARKRAEREALRAASRSAHAHAVTVADAASGMLTAYAQGAS
jgi:hypothetical protein